MSNAIDEIKKLSISERILAVESIWDSIANSNNNYAVSDEEKKILNERLADYNANTSNCRSWDEVKKRIEKQL